MNEALLNAYLKTTYQVPSLQLNIFANTHSNELDQILNQFHASTWAFITAWNPYSQALSAAANQARQLSLQKDLSAYQYFDGYGIGEDTTWPPEHSYFVLDISRQAALDLGIHYEQNALLWGALGQPSELLITAP